MQAEHDDEIGPSKNHDLYYDPSNPHTLVMLKNIELMSYLEQSFYQIDSHGNKQYKIFPNYLILNNIEVSHQQKRVLSAMLQQNTSPQIMIRQFCRLAYRYYPSQAKKIKKFQNDFTHGRRSVSDILKWYTEETFFYKMLNRLLRKGQDPTQLYYGQHFTKLLSSAIKQVYLKQKGQQNQIPQISEGDFVCYRGGHLSDKEIEQLQNNVGKNIETLGFLSTSLLQSEAEHFITNILYEIEVRSLPRAEELDNGYAFLTAQYSTKPGEEQILFNVLSSFRIKSIAKLYKNSIEYWHVKLEYGVTYQMMQQYKQNKLSLERGPTDYEQVLAIMAHQNQLKKIGKQEDCLAKSEEYVWMMKTKISLLKSIPQCQQISRSQEISLYVDLTTVEKLKGKQRRLTQRIEQMLEGLHQAGQQIQQQSSNFLFHKLKSMVILLAKYYKTGNWEQIKQLTAQWEIVYQQILQNPDFLPRVGRKPILAQMIKFWAIWINFIKVRANLQIYRKRGDCLELREELKVAGKLLDDLLEKQGRYNFLYGIIGGIYADCCFSIGLIDYQTYLEKREQQSIRKNGEQINQKVASEARTIPIWKQANMHIQKGEWTKGLQVCARFRQKQFQGKYEQDLLCFQPIIHNSNKLRFPEKLEILELCLKFQHPSQSKFFQQAKNQWKDNKKILNQYQQEYIEQTSKILGEEPPILLDILQKIRRMMLKLIFPENGMISITHQCLVVNTMRMYGLYEQANKYFGLLKKKIRAGNHPQYYEELNLGLFQQQQAN